MSDEETRKRKHKGDLFSSRDASRAILAPFEVVKEWAYEQKIPFSSWEDLRRINEHAELVGHVGFKREMPVHRTAAQLQARMRDAESDDAAFVMKKFRR